MRKQTTTLSLSSERIVEMKNKISDLLKISERYKELNKYVNDITKNPEKNPFKSSELMADFLSVILSVKTNRSYISIINSASGIYGTMFPLDEKTEDYDELKILFLKIFQSDGIYFSGAYSDELYLSFRNKAKYTEVMEYILKNPLAVKKISFISRFAASVRSYYADETCFCAAVIDAAIKLSHAEDIESETDKLIRLSQKSAGIYAVDEYAINHVDRQVNVTQAMLSQTNSTLDIVNGKINSLQGLTDESVNELQSIALNEIEKLHQYTANASLELQKAHKEFLQQEHNNIIFEKDKLVREIFDATESKIRELRLISDTITQNTSAELHRINSEANNAVDKVASVLNNNGELKNVLSEIQDNSNLIEKILKVEAFRRQFDETQIPAKMMASNAAVPVAAPNIPITSDNISADRTVNYFFNESIPFSNRIGLLKEKMQCEIDEKNEIYHKKFFDVLIALIEDSNPYLIGPSGCGKTYMIEQLSNLLGVSFVDIGYINEEYDIIGFQTASGGYNYPTFYKAYKYGTIAFCDELDNGNSRATVKLNSFLSSSSDACYCFPNGETVKKHPNFRIIGAGNTAGNGADQNYNTREKIEESIQQRFTPIFIDYDNRIEESILCDYPEWFEFIVRFRKATDAWSKQNEFQKAPGIITTRDAARIKKYLDHKSFGLESIIEYEFVQIKDNEYLAFLDKELYGYYADGKRISQTIYNAFNDSVHKLRNNGGAR